MRTRTALLAVTSAFALFLTIPGTASAAVGEFTYRYLDEDGDVQSGSLIDPPSRECIDIPEVSDLEDVHAFRPRNDTGSRAVVFKESGCEGDAYFSLRPDGGHGSDRLLLRSVVFN
ncbi:hypothetical protein [Kibdelosporangium phytohabitans]|uniref:Uncharacterized protein n=1 Tax=Kibdelosporangium phytohabitans TaxID=860235 RepID=A0A0N9IFI8_9PSEU|nr:hypothetical protein [Kibdelosporangium phytohabitans]ALG13625.1 hypothetical protein AOZ06_48265 [Kibdelosporangium phytohabitans]MBE1465505.1 hypothetical protein [Kibdelosporangium phytohabitans]